MLNNEQLIELAEQAAQIFKAFEASSVRSKTVESNIIRTLLDAVSQKKFINELVPIIKKGTAENAEALNVLVTELNKMPRENFAYFITLIRFKYAYLNRKEQA